jgi:PilZ domain
VNVGRGLRRFGERRSARRVPVDRVFMHAAGEEGTVGPDEAVKLIGLDVSEHGCRALSVGRVLHVGDVVRIVFTPTMRGDVGIRARVVRSERQDGGRTEVAFTFDRLAPSDRARILEWQSWWERSSDAAGARPRPSVVEPSTESERLAELNDMIRSLREERRRQSDGTQRPRST